MFRWQSDGSLTRSGWLLCTNDNAVTEPNYKEKETWFKALDKEKATHCLDKEKHYDDDNCEVKRITMLNFFGHLAGITCPIFAVLNLKECVGAVCRNCRQGFAECEDAVSKAVFSFLRLGGDMNAGALTAGSHVLGNAIKSFGDLVGGDFGDALGGVGGVVSGGGELLGDALAGVTDYTDDVTQAMYDGVKGVLDGDVGALVDTGGEVVGRTGEALGDAASRGKEVFEDVGDEIVSWGWR